jgi:uncharacterized damage-inducible protein DinB
MTASVIKHAFTFVPLAALAFSAVSSAAELADADRQEGLAQLERTRSGVVEATRGMSEAQWKFKPGPDRWSAAEVLEHIAVTEDLLFEMISKKIIQAPPGKADRDYKALDKMVVKAIADRSRKAQAPEPLTPTGRWSPQQALDHFLESRARTVEYLKSTPDLREHVMDSPLGQPLDAYQWLLYASAHSERHTRQILEVKAAADFPK